MAVVAAGELDHAVALREAAREPERAHRRLGPGGDEPDLLHGRDRVHDLGRELDLGLRWRPEARAAERRAAYGLDRLRVRVPEEQRPPGHHPVEIPIAVDVLEIGALAALDEEGLVEADRLHRADRRVDAAGNQLERAPVKIGART